MSGKAHHREGMENDTDGSIKRKKPIPHSKGMRPFCGKRQKWEKERESGQETKRNPPVPLRPKLLLFDPALFTGAANP